MKRDRRFPVVLSKTEQMALRLLAELERISAAAVVRRLIWREAERMNVVPETNAELASKDNKEREV